MTHRGRIVFLAAFSLLLTAFYIPVRASDQANAAGTQTETLVFFRHGEKPYGDLGQLTCQGLKRALALPNVLVSKFGRPDHIFAPSPDEKVHRIGVNKYYYYVRPWATIEPTAVMCQMPVNLSVGFTHIDEFQKLLSDDKYWNSTNFIVWEHWEIHDLTQNILKTCGGDPSQVPQWQEPDYDSLYIITLVRKDGKVVSAKFTHDYEGLNNIKAAQLDLKYLDKQDKSSESEDTGSQPLKNPYATGGSPK